MNLARYFKLTTQASFLPFGFSSYRAQHTTTDTSTTNRFDQKTTSGLMGSGGIGFTVGKKMNSTDTDTTTVTQNGSTVGSLHGDTVIQAGEKYKQVASTVNSPEGNVSIKGKSVDIVSANNTENTTTTSIQKQSGLTIAVSTPVTDAIMAAKAVYDGSKDIGKSKNDRVNAMAVANTGWGAYQAGKSIASAASNPTGKGTGGVSVSITYGQSEAKQTSVDNAAISVGSVVNAGGKVNIAATGGGTDSNINIVGSDVYGGTGAILKADNKINILSAEDVVSNRSKNQSYSANAGVAIAFDNGVSFGITAGGSYGTGKSNSDTVTQHNSHVGSGGLTTLESGGTTTIAGGQVTGKRVEVDAQDLVIQSKQDTSKANSQQFDASLQVTVGYGFSASGSLSASKAKADYASVDEQSGIIAGDGGYDVNVKNSTNSIGGIVTSSQAAEDAGKNSFSTGTLTSTDIQNHADYSATGFGIGGGFGMNGTGAQNGMTPQNTNSTAQGKASLTVNKSVGFGQDSGHDRSTTESGINTSNITITNPEAQAATGQSVEQIKAEVVTDTVTDTVVLNSGHIENNYDAQAVQDEINLQVRLSQQFDKNRQEAKAEINKAAEDNRKDAEAAKARGDIAEYDRLMGVADQWQKGGILLDMVAGGLSAPTSSAAGIAASTLAPAVSYEIGQYFKDLADKNADGKLTSGQEAAHILAHTILGAATAAAGGNNVLIGGLSAGGAELAAPAVAQYLYGKDAKDLTADEKSTVSAIVGLGGAAVGVTTGSAGDIAGASVAAQNAVENNFLTHADAEIYRNAIKLCNGDSECEDRARKKAIEAYQKNESALELAILRGDLATYNALLASAATSSEIPFDGTRTFTQRAETLSQGISPATERTIQQIAGLRNEICGGISTSACDIKVNQLRIQGDKKALTLVSLAMGAGVSLYSVAATSVVTGVAVTMVQGKAYKVSDLIYDSTLGALIDKYTGAMVSRAKPDAFGRIYLEVQGVAVGGSGGMGVTPIISKQLGKYDLVLVPAIRGK